MNILKKKQFQILPILLIGLIWLILPGMAAAKEWKIDANHSGIGFGVKHIFSTVWGHFSDYDGTIIFDPNALDQSRFDFTVQVKSINTFNGKRDNHLRSNDFFSADKFPVMRFTSSKIMHQSDNRYIVEGMFQIKETKKQMQIPFIFHGTAPSPFNKKQIVAGFDAQFEINRLEFGVGSGKFKQMGVVDDVVRVMITVEALRSK